ncbi:Alpha/Beta hydrolase protein [Macrophomina phaseolina]|uniref:Carboxylic ester hydrolase n=1 Tax=Macrophomina phaseolina TaxID=35725 RepID=A0ABQ8GII3_9PEZI|nr:Alpha/Beta hydrolase protein [Macrophomina phaseolina]
MRSTTTPERAAVVALPTSTVPSYIQTVVGQQSPISEDIEEFRGIPYAYVPGRWEHSQLRDRLPRDIFDARKNGPKCPQSSTPHSRSFQSYLPMPDDREDEFECLNLLIVCPSKQALLKHDIDPETTKLPVFVVIHGGGFSDGAATYPMWDPSRLVFRAIEKKTPIIAVAINYRLSIFGFGASSDILAAQGTNAPLKGFNFGLRDQKLALVCVKRKIGAFGGDGAKITITGHSAGAISCHALVLEAELDTKEAPFRKALLGSGGWGGLNFRSVAKADEQWEGLCRFWSVEAESPVERLNMLKRIPPKDLLHSTKELRWILTVLTIDGLTIRESDLGCDVSIHLGDADLNNEVKTSDENIQVMVGATATEVPGFVRFARYDYAKVHAAFMASYPSKAAAEEVLQAYNVLPTSSEKELFEALTQLLSDPTIVHPTHRAGEFLKTYRSKQAFLRGQDPTRVGAHTYHIEFGNPFLGPEHGIAHHGVDVIYAFGGFHGALEKADKGILGGYVEPEQESAKDAHSELGLIAEETKAVKVDTQRYGRSNIELSHDLQDMYIQFVVETVQESETRTNPDKITTYGRDRVARTESWTSSEKWVSRRKRYDIMKKDMGSILAATRRLVGSALNQRLE